MGIGGMEIILILAAIVLLIFWLWMLIDCLKRQDGKFAVGGQNAKLIWVLIILIMPFIVANMVLSVPDVITHMFRLLFAQFIGALIYYFLLKERLNLWRRRQNKMSRITTIFIFTAVMLFNLSSGAQAADWNMWGKDAGHTSFTTDSVEPPLKVSWTFDLGFPSSFEPVPPVVSNNTVYINGISVDGQNVQNWLFAIDAKSGKLLWKYKGGGYPVWIASSGDLVVVSDGVNVYALSNGAEKWKREIGSGNQPLIIYKNLVLSGQAFALSLENGSLVWTYEPKLPSADETHLVNNWARPLAAGEDKVILAVQSIQTYYTGPRVSTVTEPPKPGEPIPPEPPQNISTILFALNAKTGKEEWVKRIPFSIESAPVISKGKVFIGSNGSVQAYLLEDGREVWRTVLPGFRKVEAVNDNLLFVGGTALSMEDGKKAFTYESSLSFPSLAVSGNILYIGGSSDSAVLEALNATTGELIWRGVKVLGYNSASKPVISGDKLFLTAQDGKLYAFSHGTPGADETLGLPMRAPSLGAVLSILVLLGAFIIRRRRNDLG